MKLVADPTLARRAASAVVANEILAEREAQFRQWGTQDYPVVFRPPGGQAYTLSSYGLWLPVVALQSRCADRFRRGVGSWADVLVEELAEAIEAGTQGRTAAARGELVQLAAAACSAVESIDRAEGRRG